MPATPVLTALPGLSAGQLAVGQIGLTVALATAGFSILLPRPRPWSPAVGTFLSLAALAVGAVFLATTFAAPTTDWVATALFWLFSVGALLFGGLLVVQNNPGRGAISFAFVILSTCGLFLLLAAPFLMAATIIIYMGAIIVTFLFVLMLSHAQGPSDENDRSREPTLGALAGFGFTGLVLFALYLGSPDSAASVLHDPGAAPHEGGLPISGVTPADRALLVEAAKDLREAANPETTPAETERLAKAAHVRIAEVVGYDAGEPFGGTRDVAGVPQRHPLQERLKPAASDARAAALIEQADALKSLKKVTFNDFENDVLAPHDPDMAGLRAKLLTLRGETLLLAGRGDLPARNVSAIGLVLYSQHLLAVELAGTLLLVATIGAVAIASRKGARS